MKEDGNIKQNSFWKDQLIVIGFFIGLCTLFYFCDFGWYLPLNESIAAGPTPISAIPIIPVILSFILLLPLYLWVYNRPHQLKHYEKQNVKSIILVFLLIFIIIMIFRTIILLKYGLPLEKTPMIFFIVLQIIFVEGFYLSDFGFHSNKFWRQIAFTFILLLVFGFLVILILGTVIFSMSYMGILNIDELLGTPISFNWYGFASFPFQLLCVGISEELLFRGYFYTKLRSATGYIRSVFLSSLIFGLFHVAWYIDPSSPWLISDWVAMISHVGSTFVFGVCMCVIFERTRSIICPIIIHGLFNAIGGALAGTQINISFKAEMWLYGLGGASLIALFLIFVKWILPRLTKWIGVEDNQFQKLK